MPTVNRSYRAIERQWLNEYLLQRYPGVRIQNEYRLHYVNPSAIARGPGGSPTGLEGRTIGRIDGYLELPASVELWEASQWLHTGQLAKAVHYKDLLPRTYEGRELITKPVHWHLLASHLRQEIQETAVANGFEYNVYLPDWLREHQIQVQAEGAARRATFAERSQSS